MWLNNRIINSITFGILILLIQSCSYLSSPSETSINGTIYVLVQDAQGNRYIKDQGVEPKIIIPDMVLGYFKFNSSVAVVRQVVNYVDCDSKNTITVITDEIEIWVLDRSEINGPFDQLKFRNKWANNGDNISSKLDEFIQNAIPSRSAICE